MSPPALSAGSVLNAASESQTNQTASSQRAPPALGEMLKELPQRSLWRGGAGRGGRRGSNLGVSFVSQCEEEGQVFFSLDDGNTKFSDLIQLVDFYQLNKGVLPCKLRHHCVRVAL